MKTVIVLGGSGYIGRQVIGQLLESNYKVINIDKATEFSEIFYSNENYFDFIHVNLADITESDLLSIVNSIREVTTSDVIYGLINLAAYKNLSESILNPLDYYDNNIKVVINSLKLVRFLGVKSYIFSSSAAVYNIEGLTTIKEDTKLRHDNPYGVTKLMGEKILEDYSKVNDVKVISLRYFNPVGCTKYTKDTSESLFGNILKCIRTKSTAQIYGNDYEGSPDGTCIRDYIDIRDLSDAHVSLLDILNKSNDKFANFDVFNVGTGNPLTVKQVMDTVSSMYQDFTYEIAPRRLGDLVGAYAVIDKLKSLGWSPKYKLTDTLINFKSNDR